MSDVFISYSRKDSDFAKKLTNILAETKRDIWVDWEDIPLAADWLHEIYAGIEAADTFVFIVSQNSLTSKVCNLEVEHALTHNKRIIPLILQEIQGDTEKYVKGTWFDQDWVTIAQENWKALGHLNWIFFNNENQFDSKFQELITTIETDLAHVKLHTRLLVRAREWETASNNPSFLLTGEEIDSAEVWLKSGLGEGKEPVSTDLHKTYIATSRERDLREKRRIANLRRASVIAGIVGGIAVILTVVASFNSFNSTQNVATAEAKVLIAEETLFPITETMDAVATQINESYRFQMAGQASFQQANENDALAFAFEAISNEQPPIDVQPIFYDIAGNSHNRLTLNDGAASMVFSPDGNTLASASFQEIKVWDVATGNVLATLSGHGSSVDSVAFSPDGNTLVSAGCATSNYPCPQGEIKVWDVATGNILTTLNVYGVWIINLVFSPDGNTLVSGSCVIYTLLCTQGEIKLWDVATGNELATLNGHHYFVNSVAFSPDGNTLVSGSCGDYGGMTQECFEGEIKLWDVMTGNVLATLSGHGSSVSSVTFSPDGNTLVSASSDNTLILWDVATGNVLTELNGSDDIAFSPDGNTLASASSAEIKFWDVATGNVLATLSGHGSSVSSVTFSPDGNTFASASFQEIKFWDMAMGNVLATLNGHESGVLSVAFSPNGNTLASSGCGEQGFKNRCMRGEIKLWDVVTGNELATFNVHNSRVNNVAFSPDGNILASTRISDLSSDSDNTVKLWDVVTGNELTTLNGHESGVLSVAFSPDGNTLASASQDKTVKLWDISSSKTLSTLIGHGSWVSSVTFSPDGNTLASASRDNTVKLWDVATGNVLATLNGHHDSVISVTFSPDGNALASASWDNTVKLWDMGTGNLLTTLNGHNSRVNSVAFSPDGNTLAASDGNGIKLWDVATGNVLTKLNGSDDIAFSPDGNILVSGKGRKIMLWNISSLPLLRQWVQENRFIREFTCEERTRFNMPVKCDAEGNFPTRTPYPTPSPIPLPSWTPFWTPLPQPTNTLEAIVIEGDIVIHIVAAGETLTSIAHQYNIDPNMLQIMNGLSDPNAIFVEQALIIPAPTEESTQTSNLPTQPPTVTQTP